MKGRGAAVPDAPGLAVSSPMGKAEIAQLKAQIKSKRAIQWRPVMEWLASIDQVYLREDLHDYRQRGLS